jgi:hypothetical protein
MKISFKSEPSIHGAPAPLQNLAGWYSRSLGIVHFLAVSKLYNIWPLMHL